MSVTASPSARTPAPTRAVPLTGHRTSTRGVERDDATLLPFPTLSADRGLVQVITGSYGAGHDAAAHQLAARLTQHRYRVEVLDVVDMFPLGLGRLLRAAYFRQLRAVPGTWTWLLRRLDGEGLLRSVVTSALATAVSGHLTRAVAASGVRPSFIVSTHPFASQALGHLRTVGRLTVPVATYLTDMSVHPLWVHRGVDLHLALHEVPADQARSRGAGRTVVVGPLATAPPEPAPASLRSARAGAPRSALPGRLGLPPEARMALVTGGSQGIGELKEAASDILATGLVTPVVLCGENEALRTQLGSQPGVVALGWRDDVPALLAAATCVVQNAGGFTSLEALAAGIPTLSYRCLPGHGQTNAQALHDAGWVPWAKTTPELGELLSAALACGPHGARPAWDDRTRADVVEVLEQLLPTRRLVPVPA